MYCSSILSSPPPPTHTHSSLRSASCDVKNTKIRLRFEPERFLGGVLVVSREVHHYPRNSISFHLTDQ